MPTASSLLVRPADASDARQVMRLAALDSAPAPTGDVMLAELDGQPVAALDTRTGAVVADPFRSTAAAVRALAAVAGA